MRNFVAWLFVIPLNTLHSFPSLPVPSSFIFFLCLKKIPSVQQEKLKKEALSLKLKNGDIYLLTLDQIEDKLIFKD